MARQQKVRAIGWDVVLGVLQNVVELVLRRIILQNNPCGAARDRFGQFGGDLGGPGRIGLVSLVETLEDLDRIVCWLIGLVRSMILRSTSSTTF